MNDELTPLAAQLERITRERAAQRTHAAIEPLVAPIVQDLRRALHKVVGAEADVVVVEEVNVLRQRLAARVGTIAEQRAIKDIVQRLTVEAQA